MFQQQHRKNFITSKRKAFQRLDGNILPFFRHVLMEIIFYGSYMLLSSKHAPMLLPTKFGYANHNINNHHVFNVLIAILESRPRRHKFNHFTPQN